MSNNYGGIIKLNRIQQNMKLEYLAKRLGMTKGQLSRIERNKENVSLENVKKAFESLEIVFFDKDIEKEFEEDFLTYYLDFVYERNYESSYHKIESYQAIIKGTTSYVKYLVAQMMYHFLKYTSDITEYLYLKDYFLYLESYQIQIFYDILLGYYSSKNLYDEALNYGVMGLNYNGNTYSTVMLHYHIAKAYMYYGEQSKALEYSLKAKNIFCDTLNLKRLTETFQMLSMIYKNIGDYQKAEETNLRCIQAFKNLNMTREIGQIYNNLLWTYIFSKQYLKVIEYKDNALESRNHDHCIYFYLSFASYKLGNIKEAKQYIKEAKQRMNQPTKYMEAMIQAFSVYLSDSQYERKEKYLLKVKNVAKESQQKDIQIFSVSLLKEFYEENRQIEKAYECANQLIKL